MKNKKQQYKQPMLLFTSGSLRFAAWAGWYSALGEVEHAEAWKIQAMKAHVQELGAGRQFWFLKDDNNDMRDYIPPETMKKLLDNLYKSIKAEIRKSKAKASRKAENIHK